MLKPTRNIPNSEGFEFTGVLWDWTEVHCVVRKGVDGLHYIDGARVSELRGWR